ncbi:MAG: SDR family oxidoreductase [Alphaproteobacteria bacterium]|nr:SDR family oxidoreductase [Alphaproteobacteria bacterium]
MTPEVAIDWSRWEGLLAGRRVLVTGASRGLGLAFAEASARAGASGLALFARDRARLAAAAESLRPLGTRVEAFDVDLADVGRLKQRVGEAERALDGIDVLINNGGTGVRGALLELDLHAFSRLFDINVVAATATAQVVVPGMLARGHGRVINVTSIYARAPVAHLNAYAVSKAALEMLTRGMALEWAGTGVTANAIGPVQVLTDLSRPSWTDPARRAQVLSQIPAGRWATTADLVAPLLHLASDASAMITGQTLFVDGGRSLL